jgi:hypothetical protein
MPVMVASDGYEGERETTAVDSISTIEKRGYSARRRGRERHEANDDGEEEQEERSGCWLPRCRLVGRSC